MNGLYLYHHGIQGQKWGVRHGPPYPLKPDALASSIYEIAKKKEPIITNDVKMLHLLLDLRCMV